MAGRKDVFDNALNQGHSAAWDQDWERAASLYAQALEEFPENAQALSSYALACYQTGKLNEALKIYLRAARSNSEDPVPLEKASELFERLGAIEKAAEAAFGAGELYAKNRDVEKAIFSWTRATRLNPDNLTAHSRLALVHERLGNKKQAVTFYVNMASLLQAAGQRDKAVQTIQRAVQILPENSQLTQVIAMLKANRPLPRPVRGGTGTLSAAAVGLAETAASLPDVGPSTQKEMNPIEEGRRKALTDLAAILFEQSDTDESSDAPRKGFQAMVQGIGNKLDGQKYDHDRIILHLSQVIEDQTRGRNSEAARELEKAVSLGFEHPAANFDLGLLHSEEERYESAVRHLNKATVDPDYSLAAHLLVGQIHHRLGKTHDAALEYLRALRVADSLMVPASQAAALRSLYDPLIENFLHTPEGEQDERLCANIADLLQEAGWRRRLEKARQQLPKSASGDVPIPLVEILTESTSSHVVEALANINRLGSQGRWRSAIDEAYWAIQHAPTYLPLHKQLGEMLLNLGYTQEAVDKFAIVARTYTVRGEPRQAVDTLRRIVEISPLDLNARRQLIDQHLTVNDVQSAVQEYNNLAGVYYSRAELDSARKAYAEALRLAQQRNYDPVMRVRILHQMADIDLQSLDWRQALREFEQIRTLKPDDEKARLKLASLNLRLGMQPQAMTEIDEYLGYLVEKHLINDAFSFLETLVEDHPDVIPIRHRLAELYRQAGRNNQSIEQFDYIAEKLMIAGDKAGAIRVINTILKLNPPNPVDYEHILSRLQRE